MRQDIGHHHPFPPEPIMEDHTRFVDAGAVRIGVQPRRLDGLMGRLQETYDGTPFETAFNDWVKERMERQPARSAAGPADTGLGGGLSIHVVGTDSGHEYLRFDCFEGVPHYHYLRPWSSPAECDNHEVDWDEVAHGPMVPWAVRTLRTRLAEMLAEAGGAEVAGRLDPAQVSRAVDQVELLVEEALGARAG